MNSEIKDETFDTISQYRYDFNNNSLEKQDTLDIKNLAKEKRAEYGIGPVGREIFKFIFEKEKKLYLEREPFENKDLDALICMPDLNKDSIYIILNSNQPLVNQAFALAHEYYHYLKNIDDIRKNPRLCYLSNLRDKMEQKASRFAAEFLLPDEALKGKVDKFLIVINKNKVKEASIEELSVLLCSLSISYYIPIKAALYRLFEEGYIDDINLYLENYTFIKGVSIQLKKKYQYLSDELQNKKNPYIEEIMYSAISDAYNKGLISTDTLKKDIETLNLNLEYFEDIIFNEAVDDEDDDLNEDLRINLLQKLNDNRV